MTAQTVKLKIDGMDVAVPAGTTILDAARRVQVGIPTLCHHPDLHPEASCGICVVKVGRRMVRACCTPVSEGMDVVTRDTEIVETRRTVLQLQLSHHPPDCLTCIRNENCELQKLAAAFGVRERGFNNITPQLEKDDSTKCIVIDPRKCILCGRCVEVCQNIQQVNALSFLKRGIHTRMSPAAGLPLADTPCIKCGQCTAHCPTGALSEYDSSEYVWELLGAADNHMVAQIAPAVRVSLGEAFGLEPGNITTGKIYAALRRLGFKAIFDTNFGADVTIMEESAEFVERFTKHPETLPLITSCCPAWVDYLEKFYPDMIHHFSTCKSPHAIVGALSKTYYAEKIGVKPEKMKVVSIMPCTAKKYEVIRSKEMFSSGFQDVDVTLTTREIARMIKQAGIDFLNLPEEAADNPLGEYTGAGTAFGFSGGVMEAALRTAHYLITQKEMPDEELEIKPILGIDKGVKEMTMTLAGKEIRIAVAHGIGYIGEVLNRVRAALASGEETPYHFIEVMACKGGCVGGGGQPRGVTNAVRMERTRGLRKDDKQSAKRCSHQNEALQALYKQFLGKPLGEKSHKLLHTHYTPRPLYKKEG